LRFSTQVALAFRDAKRGHIQDLGRLQCGFAIDQHQLLNMMQSDEVNALFKRFDELFAAADYAAAEQEARRLEADVKMRFGEDHAGYSLALEKLATVCERQGKDAEAEKLYERILERREQTPGTDLTEALEKLAYVYAKQCKYAKAEQLFKRVGLARAKAPAAVKDGTTLQKYWTAAQVPDVVGIVGLLEFLGHSRKALTASLEYDLQHGFAPGSGAAAAAGSAAQKKPLPNWLAGLVPSRLTLWKASFMAILLIGLATQFFGLPDLKIPARPTTASNVATLSPAQKRVLQPKDTFKECDACPEMVVVPAGSFTMGSPANELQRSNDEGPQRQVTFARPFAVGKFAITFDEWDACVRDGGCNGYRASDGGWGRGRRPVINVSWDDAKAYVAWLSRKTGKTYRLLSEAEREYVTRAGSTTPFWWGSTISTGQANYDGSYSYGSGKGEYRQQTVPVHSFEPNPWGIYQMHGNVWEWTEDCWHPNYNGAPTDGSAWTSERNCFYRVVRGGSWLAGPSPLRAAFRSSNSSSQRVNTVGLRVARTLPESPDVESQLANVAPQGPAQVAVLTPAKERALKPKDSFKECDACPEMVVVPAGSFTMGSPANELQRDDDEGPQHQVTFAQAFAVGKYAVTFEEWDACVRDGGCDSYRPADKGWGRGRQPVINVSWSDAKSYVAWLTGKTGKPYRLLSEAEREYVTRAGTTKPFWSDSTISIEQANYDGNATYGNGRTGEYRRRTVPVDSYQPNSWGLYQVHGNVHEWTEDCWNNNYNGAPTDGSAWTSGNCAFRVMRGGSWFSDPAKLRSAHRANMPVSSGRSEAIGFRVARTLTASPETDKGENLKLTNSLHNAQSTTDRVIAYIERGNAYYSKGDHGRAIADYSEAVKLDGKNAVGYANRALAYQGKGDYDHALSDYSQAISLNGNNALTYSHRASLFLAKGEYDPAVADLSKAITLDPKNIYTYQVRCFVYLNRKDYDRAITDCNEAIRLDPNSDYSLSLRGFVYVSRGSFDLAFADCAKAIKLNQKSSAGYNCRGRVHHMKKEFDSAFANYSEAIKLDATNASAYLYRGELNYHGGSYAHAIEDFNEAIRLDPKYFQAYNERGKTYLRRGDNNSAIADFSQAIQLNPLYVEAYNNRGLVYRALGLKAAAIDDFRKAQSIDPSDKTSKAQLRNLGG
jgi:formylglycine-generating enzyme required for sulfatase activity/tetratricopeptide (TPR) repeat protein